MHKKWIFSYLVVVNIIVWAPARAQHIARDGDLRPICSGPLWKQDPWSRDIQNRIFSSVQIEPTAQFPTDACRKKLTELLGMKPITCSLLLKPAGEIADIKISKSSGDPELDQKAVQLIQQSAPFLVSEYELGNIPYFVEFPALNVVPGSIIHDSYRMQRGPGYVVSGSLYKSELERKLAPWFNACQNRINNCWYLANQEQSFAKTHFSCTFLVRPAGVIDNVEVGKSTGSADTDLAGLKIIWNSSPLPPPPVKLPEGAKISVELAKWPLPEIKLVEKAE